MQLKFCWGPFLSFPHTSFPLFWNEWKLHLSLLLKRDRMQLLQAFKCLVSCDIFAVVYFYVMVVQETQNMFFFFFLFFFSFPLLEYVKPREGKLST